MAQLNARKSSTVFKGIQQNLVTSNIKFTGWDIQTEILRHTEKPGKNDLEEI